MRCIISPVVLASKYAMGRRSNLAKKSDKMLRLTLVLMCSNIHDRINSTDIRPIIKANCAPNTKYTNCRLRV